MNGSIANHHHSSGGVGNPLSTLTRNLRKKSKSTWSLRVKSPSSSSAAVASKATSEAAQLSSALAGIFLGNFALA